MLCFAAKSKTLSGRCSDSLSGSQSIRRTASLDTIYLKGQWPRESYYMHSSLLVDKSTQVNILFLPENIDREVENTMFVFIHCFLHVYRRRRNVPMNQEKCILVIPRNKLSLMSKRRRITSGIGTYPFITKPSCLLFLQVHWKSLYATHTYCYCRLQRTNKEGTSSRERTAAFGLIMPGGPLPALPGDHSVLLPSIASQTSMRE